jgi:type II secretory pathway pseudopilin PulG
MKKRSESGFAMLLVFLMAATIAITLYLEIPRVAFQAQRQKEQLLIERGEQYKRAIQLFVRVNGRYPGDLKDLENFNNRRFLRHKFIDPMTGKDDWRIVHINNGVLTDSVLNKQKPGDASQQTASTSGQYVGEQAAIGSALTPAQQNLNAGLSRRRVSEGGAVPTVGPDGQPIAPGQPLPGQPITGFEPIPGQPMPGQPVPGPVFPTQPGAGQPIAQPLPGQQQTQSFPGGQMLPGQVPGQPFPGTPANSGQVQPQPFLGAQPGAQPFPGQVQAQPFPGTPTPGTPIPPELTNPGGVNSAGQPIPGRLPGFTPPGVPANPNTPGQPYVGGSQPYVGGSQPYVGGGQYIGAQPTPTQGVPQPAPFTPNPANPQPVPTQPNFPAGGVPQPFGAPQPFGTPQPSGTPQPFGTPQTTNPGFPGPTGQSPATDMINNILRNPRPIQAGTAPGGQQIGGGIAGIASKSENAAIMIYNDRTNYNEWEFVFDYTKQAPLPNPSGGTIGTSAASLGSVAGNPSPAATPSPTGVLGAGFGTSPTPGPQGQSPFGQPQGQNPSGQPAGQAAGMPQLPPGLRPGRP